MKVYKAKSHIALNVVTNEGNAHISFSPVTGGGSEFYTKDEALQAALEKHPKFGKLFKAVEVEPPVIKMAEPKKKVDESKVEVSSADDAKEYLIDSSASAVQSCALLQPSKRWRHLRALSLSEFKITTPWYLR